MERPHGRACTLSTKAESLAGARIQKFNLKMSSLNFFFFLIHKWQCENSVTMWKGSHGLMNLWRIISWICSFPLLHAGLEWLSAHCLAFQPCPVPLTLIAWFLTTAGSCFPVPYLLSTKQQTDSYKLVNWWPKTKLKESQYWICIHKEDNNKTPNESWLSS